MYVLKPSRQKHNHKVIVGFDIETYGQKNEFLLCSFWKSDNDFKVCYSKEEAFAYLLSGKLKDCIVVASNLSFDFFGLFHNSIYTRDFNMLFRGSDLICAKSYFYNGRLNKKSDGHKSLIMFLDTMNYAKMSVENLGKIISVPKLHKPKRLGKKPVNKSEWDYLVKYNINDSKISCLALRFLYDKFEDLGATAKLTLASTSMSLYKNKYLANIYFRHDELILIDLFEGYYGGRTEAFKRGKFKKHNYYDVNSLYPSVMLKKFPDPNSLRVSHYDENKFIQQYEGLSRVTVVSPDSMHYPLLPFRTKDKLIFPLGEFTSWQSHIELRKALELGYKIKKVFKSYYYLKNCEPFKGFINDMYGLRSSYKVDKNPAEMVVKILMNSLYGKFGQKFLNKENLIPNNLSAEELHKLKSFEILGDEGEYLRIKQDRIPSAFCIPIWALYVTAYGRLRLYDLIVESNAIYCDTDSIITEKVMPCSDKLGDLKLEMFIDKGFIVKPKFYAVRSNGKDYIKIKGVGTKITWTQFRDLFVDNKITYTKFMKIRESLRRGFIPNEIKEVYKQLSLEDEKRVWDGKFDSNRLQDSVPLNINTYQLSEKEMIKSELLAKKKYDKKIKEQAKSDLFDKFSKGKDISDKEFIENEIFFERFG